MADSAEKSSGAEKKRGGKVHRMDGGLEEHFKMSLAGKRSAAQQKTPQSDGEERRRSALEVWTSAKKDERSQVLAQEPRPENGALWTEDRERVPLYNLSGGKGRQAILGAHALTPSKCTNCGSEQHLERDCPTPPGDFDQTDLKSIR